MIEHKIELTKDHIIEMLRDYYELPSDVKIAIEGDSSDRFSQYAGSITITWKAPLKKRRRTRTRSSIFDSEGEQRTRPCQAGDRPGEIFS